MAEFNTVKRQYFESQQTLYSAGNPKFTEKYEQAAYAEALGVSPTDARVDLAREWFSQLVGYSDAYSKNLSDLWYRYLGSKGFTGSLRDRLKKFYEDGSINLNAP